ncbi:MAG: hypothetical protein Q4P06_00850 [Actinomycetaceae bacterium]|nr:hypothetical protein [Actinomycetaceae bacterium]
MSFNVGTLNAEINLDSTRFDQGLDNAERALKALGTTSRAIGKTIAAGFTAATATPHSGSIKRDTYGWDKCGRA